MLFCAFITEFHEWKAEEEGSQNCWFILPRDPKKLASGETRIHYYCNRSGEARKRKVIVTVGRKVRGAVGLVRYVFHLLPSQLPSDT